MSKRMAGELLTYGLLGAGGAVGADAVAHGDMDRLASQYQGFMGQYERAPGLVQQAYAQVFGQGGMSQMDRIIATAVLSGAIPPAQGSGPVKADSAAGGKAIKLAGELRQQEPELSKAVAALADQEVKLFAKEALMGVSPGDVMSAAEQGAGVSPIPAVLGGLGAGGGTALLVEGLRRRRNA